MTQKFNFSRPPSYAYIIIFPSRYHIFNFQLFKIKIGSAGRHTAALKVCLAKNLEAEE